MKVKIVNCVFSLCCVAAFVPLLTGCDPTADATVYEAIYMSIWNKLQKVCQMVYGLTMHRFCVSIQRKKSIIGQTTIGKRLPLFMYVRHGQSTRDDPMGGSPGYTYFNVTSEYLRNDSIHRWDESAVPEAAGTAYAYSGH